MNHVVLITTGGTVAGGAADDGSIVPQLRGIDFASWADTSVTLTIRDLMAVDSASMTFADLDVISAAVAQALADPETAGVVVLHGTDAMEETAMLVDLHHDDPRPVVFTGAQRPADDPDTDGPRNVRAAIELALDPASAGHGVLIAFGGACHHVRGTRKVHTTALDAFGGGTTAVRTVLRPRPIAGTRVDIVALYPGVDRVAMDAAVAAGARGIVLEAMGGGNANAEIVAAVRDCVARGVIVLVSTRVHRGPVAALYGGGGGGRDLVAAGALVSPQLRSGQTRILLAALLAEGADRDEIAAWFQPY